MAEIDWVTRLQRWPRGIVGEFLGTRFEPDSQSLAARRWLRKLLKTDCECLALCKVLFDKGIITRLEYTIAIEEAARTLCQELEREFPGLHATEVGVTFDVARANETMKDWPR